MFQGQEKKKREKQKKKKRKIEERGICMLVFCIQLLYSINDIHFKSGDSMNSRFVENFYIAVFSVFLFRRKVKLREKMKNMSSLF